MRPVYYVTPDWPENPGLLHGILDEPLKSWTAGRISPYQVTICGRSILKWWRAASIPEDLDRPVCKHCGPAIILFLYDGMPPPPTGDSSQMRLPLQPPRPDVRHCS